jgi:hypothetical protein
VDSTRYKAIIDLHEYLHTLGHDRPPVGAMLKTLNIDPKTMQDAVMGAAIASALAKAEFAFDILNDLFKLGVTIGYKYAVTKQMEKEFGLCPESEEEDGRH